MSKHFGKISGCVSLVALLPKQRSHTRPRRGLMRVNRTTITLLLTLTAPLAVLPFARGAETQTPAKCNVGATQPNSAAHCTFEQSVAEVRKRQAAWPSRQIRHSANLLYLPVVAQLDVSYEFDGKRYNINSFMSRDQAVGVIVIRDGKIVAERYRAGNGKDSLWGVASVTKSVTSTLVGAAIKDGAIKSVNDPAVKYVPELAGTPFSSDTIRDLLRMSSGVDIHDEYNNPHSKYASLGKLLAKAYGESDPNAAYHFFASLKRKVPPGTEFSYSSPDYFILGQVVANAVKKPLTTYLNEKIWMPMGMEYDGQYRLDAAGQEWASGGMRITLRDMARFGLLALHNGMIDGQSICPDGWFKEATSVPANSYLSPGHIEEFKPWGYAYGWWLMPPIDGDRVFAALGVFGQQIYVIPKANIVVAIQSDTPKAAVLKKYAAGFALASAFDLKLRHWEQSDCGAQGQKICGSGR